jgi:AraC family transcriptional activator of pobA
LFFLKSKTHIPNYTLTDLAKKGVLMINMRDYAAYPSHAVSRPHRDDHFTILVLSSGKFELNIDFETVKLAKPSFLLISPEQVHDIGKIEKIQGWLINIEPSVIYPEIVERFYEYPTKPILLETASALTPQLFSLLQTAEALSGQDSNLLIEKTIKLIINAALSLVIASVLPDNGESVKRSRGTLIYKQFRALLERHFKTWKQASRYASEVSITPTHLNDTVKEQTGLTVTEHIQNRSVLEAKRLLFFTDMSVSETCYQTGYNDPVHFGKLFRKVTGLTPLAFRKKFRE